MSCNFLCGLSLLYSECRCFVDEFHKEEKWNRNLEIFFCNVANESCQCSMKSLLCDMHFCSIIIYNNLFCNVAISVLATLCNSSVFLLCLAEKSSQSMTIFHLVATLSKTQTHLHNFLNLTYAEIV